jgi:hypothetical protein
MEADTGIMKPQVREHLQPPKLGEAKGESPPDA